MNGMIFARIESVKAYLPLACHCLEVSCTSTGAWLTSTLIEILVHRYIY